MSDDIESDGKADNAADEDDIDGDGKADGTDDDDTDGDGIPDGHDDDVDGDGVMNDLDTDDDGDGDPDDVDPDDDGDETPDEDEGGGGGGSGGGGSDCDLEIRLEAVCWDSGEIYTWPAREEISRNPPGGWHVDFLSGGPVRPVVSSFGDTQDLTVRIRLESIGVGCPQVAMIRARLGETVLGSADLPIYGALPETITLWLPGVAPIPGSSCVRRIASHVQFEYSTDGGTHWVYFGMARPATWYVVADRRFATPGIFRYELYLQKVLQYAAGSVDDIVLARRISGGMAVELCYDPSEPSPSDLNAYPMVYSSREAQCSTTATLMSLLCRTSGVGANVVFTWGGLDATRADRFNYDSCPVVPPTFRLRAPRNNRAPEDPHFTFHAVASVAGALLDPSYGSVGLPPVIELAPGAAQQTGPYLPDGSNWFHSGLTCPHSCTSLLDCN